METKNVFTEHKRRSSTSSVWFYYVTEKTREPKKCKTCQKKFNVVRDLQVGSIWIRM